MYIFMILEDGNQPKHVRSKNINIFQIMYFVHLSVLLASLLPLAFFCNTWLLCHHISHIARSKEHFVKASDNIQLFLHLPCIQVSAGGNIYFSNTHGIRLGIGGNKNVVYIKTCGNSKQRRHFSSTVVVSVIPPQGVVSFNNLWMLSEPRKRLGSCERLTTKCFQINMHHNDVITAVPWQKFALNSCEHSTYSGIVFISR